MKLGALHLRRHAESRRAHLAVVDAATSPELTAGPESFLSPVELAHYASLRFAEKRNAYLLGRLAAKQAAGALMGENDLNRIEIYAGAFGQPLLRHPQSAGLEISVSHSQACGVAIAYPAEWPIGVDLEIVSAESVAAVMPALEMSAAEQRWLDLGTVEIATACGMLWSAREALGKSMKIGLNCPLGILALKELLSMGEGAWLAHYVNFPQSKCLIQEAGGRVLTIALPLDVELESWP